MADTFFAIVGMVHHAGVSGRAARLTLEQESSRDRAINGSSDMSTTECGGGVWLKNSKLESLFQIMLVVVMMNSHGCEWF